MFTDNHHIPQRALGHVSPVDALKSWQQKEPDLFVKRIFKQAALDTHGATPDRPQQGTPFHTTKY